MSVSFVRKLCKSREENLGEYPANFISACQKGDVKKLEKIVKKYENINSNEGLTISVSNKQLETAKFFIERNATNLDDCLAIACVNNNYEMVELLIQKGARTVVGIRTAKSPNILRMIYRYEQKTEVIN